MHQITVSGHVGSDPEYRTSPSGFKFCSFPLAVNIYSKEERPPIWYKITMPAEPLPPIMSTIKKGSGLIITGELSHPRPYLNKKQEPAVSLTIKPLSIKFMPMAKSQDKKDSGFSDEDIPF